MNIRPYIRLLLLPAILTLILNGCATAPPTAITPPADADLLLRAQKAINQGNLEMAAREYMLLAEQGSALKRPEYLLQATALLLQGNYVDQAERVLNKIDPATLHDLQLIRRQLLAARIALINHRTGDALQALEIPIPPALTDAQLAELYQLRAEAYSRRNDPLKAAENYVLSSLFITETTAQLATQYKIWQLLAAIPDQEINNIPVAPAPDAFSGWLELVRIARASQNQPLDVAAHIARWHQQYPQHNVDQAILDALLARQGKAAQHPQHIALLLPFEGPYQKPASVIRDGFLAAYYQHRSNQQPAQNIQNNAFSSPPGIRIYDTSRFKSITQAYSQAVTDGAEFIVGPLAKDDVTLLSNAKQLPVPTLTLNYSESDHSPPGLYQLGLAPEQEAQQVAERAWIDGQNQALMITPDSEWGNRVAQAFAEHWDKLGGTLMKQQSYPSDKTDFAVQIQALLELDISKARYHKLKTLLHEDLRFEPRRRQDTDFIFLAAFPRQARLLRPQLKFHYASDLPVYATSHVFTGKRDRYTDRDMDDILFCDTPWTLERTAGPLKRQIGALWPEPMRDYARFYALGIDAYNLIPQLEYLRMFRHERFNGMTGTLSLNQDQHIYRTLKWAQFNNGLPSIMP
jgi:hypothetical protein